MSLTTPSNHYHRASIALHWAMLLLFIGVYASIELRVVFEKGSEPREMIKSLHFMLGLLMFALVWVRLAMRIKYPAPPIQPALSTLQQVSAKLAHVAL